MPENRWARASELAFRALRSADALAHAEMGRTAAHLVHQMLGGARFAGRRILVPPVGIDVLESTRHQPVSSPHVKRARHYIRQNGYQGIKTEQVADCVGSAWRRDRFSSCDVERA